MKHALYVYSVVVATNAAMAVVPIRVIRTIDTREPAELTMHLLRQETIDLRVKVTNYGLPVDLTGWAVMLHGRTEGQSAVSSYQVPGISGTADDPEAAAAGWMSAQVDVDAWWPVGADAGTWALVATAPESAVRIMRVGGPLTVRGTAAADAKAPLPQSLVDSLATKAALIAASNALASAIQEGNEGSGDADAVRAEFLETNILVNAAIALRPTYADVDTQIQTYLITSNAWMIISNSTLSIYAPTGSATAASLVWESAESTGTTIDPQATNLLWQALSSGLQSVNSGLATKAPKAWGQSAPDGSVNPDPDFMTFLNAPATVLAGGSTWATSGTYGVLVAVGTVAFAAGASGELRIGPDLATNWFGYRQGGSYMVGARADAFAIHDVGTTNGYATIVYDYDGGDFPTMWFTPTLGLDFVTVDAVWVDNADGSATATVAAQAARGFYRATTTANIDSLFVTTMPAVFEGGIFGSTNAPPVIYDSTITVTSGGKSYRIPAQEVK